MKTWACALAIAAAFLITSGRALGAPAYDAAAQFDATNNPAATNGWSYGHTPTLGGPFGLLDEQYTDSNWIGWDLTSDQNIFVEKNKTGSDLHLFGTGSTLFVPKDGLTFGPSNGAAYGIVRWTVPTTAAYTLDTAFTGAWTSSTGTNADVHILLNGLSLFDDNVLQQSTVSDSRTLALLAGDTIDYAVGRGTDNSNSNDRVILSAQISVPEPGSVAALFFGICLVARIRPMKRR